MPTREPPKPQKKPERKINLNYLTKIPSKINPLGLARDRRIREDPRLAPRAEVSRRFEEPRPEKREVIKELIPNKTIKDNWPIDPRLARRLSLEPIDVAQLEEKLKRSPPREKILSKNRILNEIIPLNLRKGPRTTIADVEKTVESRVQDFLMTHRTRYTVAQLTELVELLIRAHSSEALDRFAILGLVERTILAETSGFAEKNNLRDYFKRLRDSMMRRR